VGGVLRKLTGDPPEPLPSPRHTGLPVPTAYMNAAYPAIPQEVQTLLLEENVTVTDLSMTDPLGFDSDETHVFADMADTFASPPTGTCQCDH
jgi:sirohydrochlorin ferrochelatase